MHVEAFTEAKNPDALGENEDVYVVLPGRLYAVVDGATDRTGRRYDGMLGGRMAARVIERALHDLAYEGLAPGLTLPVLLQRMAAAFRAAYRHFGVFDEAQTTLGARFCGTLVLAVDRGDSFGFFVVGDSGLRLNGRELMRPEMKLDLITGRLRRAAFRRLRAKGADDATTEMVSRAFSWHGTGALRPETVPWFSEAELAALRADVAAEIAAALPEVPAADTDHLLRLGIVGAQDGYRNRAGHVLGYSCFDGFEVPPSLVVAFDRPKSEIASIELFSDGYFAVPEGHRIADWEAGFRETEARDFAKIDPFISPKGSFGRHRADDRTVVVVSVPSPR